MNYNEAVKALNNGGRVARSGWPPGDYLRQTGHGPVLYVQRCCSDPAHNLQKAWYVAADDEAATDWVNIVLAQEQPAPPATEAVVDPPSTADDSELDGSWISPVQMLLILLSLIATMSATAWFKNHDVTLPPSWHLQLPADWPAIHGEHR